jgi:hypothetical protein
MPSDVAANARTEKDGEPRSIGVASTVPATVPSLRQTESAAKCSQTRIR